MTGKNDIKVYDLENSRVSLRESSDGGGGGLVSVTFVKIPQRTTGKTTPENNT
jgi:hypothetical protein